MGNIKALYFIQLNKLMYSFNKKILRKLKHSKLRGRKKKELSFICKYNNDGNKMEIENNTKKQENANMLTLLA